MPTLITKPTLFVMRIMTSETTAQDITIRGLGLTYDAATGRLLGGLVQEVALSDLTLTGKKFAVQTIHQVSGLEMNTGQLATLFGTSFWNEAKVLAPSFDKLVGLNPDSSSSYFSATKSHTQATEGGDHVTGSRFADVMAGLGGDDHLLGAQGNDTLDGGAGDDLLDGGAGQDFLTDDSGRNQFLGGNGNDTIRGGTGNEILQGGRGNDILYGHGGTDLINGGADKDAFVFNAKDGGQVIINDFKAGDVLVNLLSGNVDETYKDFLTHSEQIGRSVVYQVDGFQLVLTLTDLKTLDLASFADTGTIAETLLQ